MDEDARIGTNPKIYLYTFILELVSRRENNMSEAHQYITRAKLYPTKSAASNGKYFLTFLETFLKLKFFTVETSRFIEWFFNK